MTEYPSGGMQPAAPADFAARTVHTGHRAHPGLAGIIRPGEIIRSSIEPTHL